MNSHSLSHWIDPANDFLRCATERPQGLGKWDRFKPLLEEIRALVPVEGDTWAHDIGVLIEPGQRNHQGQARHQHDEWTAIFYTHVGDPVVPLMLADGQFDPSPGDVVIMPPHTEHWVAPSRSTTPRVSFAMLVKDPEIPSKFEKNG